MVIKCIKINNTSKLIEYNQNFEWVSLITMIFQATLLKQPGSQLAFKFTHKILNGVKVKFSWNTLKLQNSKSHLMENLTGRKKEFNKYKWSLRFKNLIYFY